MKKLVSLFLTLMIIFALALCPITAAAITSYGGTVAVLPGNTRSSSPVYNYAWLDNVIIRDDAMAVTAKAIKPVPEDYPGSHTYDEFIKEVEQYSVFKDIDENTVAAAYQEVNSAMFYLVTASGMTGTFDEMREYLQNYGIRLPGNEDAEAKASIAVVYAALKYDAVYVLYGKEVEIPQGTTLEGATVIILSALTDTPLPSGINTLTGFAFNTMKNYVTRFDELPVSQNPSPDEVFHWVKLITAASNDYQVPVYEYTQTTTAQKEYVDYAYFASILSTFYDVTIDPIKLIIATQSDDELAVQKLILQTMLSEKGVDFTYEMSAEELFNLATANGCFELEEEFYSDIMKYEITVAETCGKIWFTPFPLADQLDGGNGDCVTMKLNGVAIEPASTTGVELFTSLKKETITLSVFYNDSTRVEEAHYEFVIVKDPALNDENTVQSDNDMVAGVEHFINTIVPDQNSEAGQIIDGIISGVDDRVQAELTTEGGGNILTTYDFDTTYGVTGETAQTTEKSTDRFDFDYLEDLIGGVYATDADGNIVTTASVFSSDGEDSSEDTIIDKAVQTVIEKPEVVVAPTGIVALGSLAGYLLTKKHRDAEVPEEDSEDVTEE